MGKGPIRAVWAAAAVFVWLWSCTYGQTTTVANGPRVIAASGTTVVDAVVPSLFANATQQLAPAHGSLSLTYESVDSPTDVRNWITHADDFAVAYIALTPQLFQQANRPLLQIPWAVANTAVVYNLPGTPEDSLRLNPQVLAGIYTCKITSWQDPAVAALNPGLSLPNVKIIPASYSESKGTTYVLTRYLSLDPSWTLGVGIQVPWPRCVQHVRTPDGILSAIAKAPGAIGWAIDWRVNATSPVQIYTANLQNAAGNFINSNATYSVDSLPVPQITSANWINVTFATSKQADIYPLGNFIFNIVGQDLSGSGPDQALAVKDVMAYFVSSAVQTNLSGWDLMPLPKALASAAQQAVATINTKATNQTRGGQATNTTVSPVGGGDTLVSGATVVEGSGGASIQNLVKAVLANASATGRFGNAGLTFAPTDSDQGKQGVITQSFSYAMSTLPLSSDELSAAARPMIQVPLGYSPIAVIHSLPNVSNNALQVNQQVLAAIFQCQITTWNDVAITALNPNITLPNQPIYPLGLSDVSGTTSLFATYLVRSPGWKLGIGTSVAWPRCVRRTIGGSNGMVNGVNATAYSIGYAALGGFINMGIQGIAVATVLNRAGTFISPYNCPFPFHQDELPPSISSTAWNTLNFNATVLHPDRYAIGGLIYLITSQDLSLLGYPQSVIMQQLALYWLSGDVQSNMSSMGASPLLPSYLQVVQQQLNALNTEAAAPAPAPGVSAAGTASSGLGQGSSKAGFPWWAGLIIGLVALALILAIAGLACLGHRRRRRRRNASLEEAIHKQDPAMAPLGDGQMDGHGAHDGCLESPYQKSQASELACHGSSEQDGIRGANSHDSDALIHMEERHDAHDDRMPLEARAASTRSFQSSGGSLRHGSGSQSQQGSLNGVQRSDRRRSSSYGKDNWTGDTSKGSWGMQSRGQSLNVNNEAAFHSLPDILKSRAENVDIDDIERGSLLGRGSFGKVYQGWWRGGTVAIKVVPHEGDLGAKVEIVRESLLSSSIQHPQIVTTYKAITVNHGAHHNMKREESIPEGATFPSSRGSGRGSGGSGNTNKSSGPREDLMETWIIMEYCDLGSLDSAIADARFKDMEHLLLRLLDVAMGMDYLHKLGILHTDLKPSNVLLKTAPKQANDPTGCTCKLADFGLSRVMETNATHISTNTIGTIAYQPEEVLKEGKVTPASDVYSFAILMYELYTCKHLFKGMMHSQMFFKVFNGYRPPIPEGTPKGLKDLMEMSWAHNPTERPSFRFIVRALQRLIIEQRRARSSGRATSMNLDDVLAGAEMAKQYPVAPSMPIHAPSDPQRASPTDSPLPSSGSQRRTPQSSGQKAISSNEFEMALLDFRKKSLASQPATQPPVQQAQHQPEPLQGSSNGNAPRLPGERVSSEDGPDTPSKQHSAAGPPPEGALPQSASSAPGGSAAGPPPEGALPQSASSAPGGSAVFTQGTAASSQAAPDAAHGSDVFMSASAPGQAGSLAGQAGTMPHSTAAAVPSGPAASSRQDTLARPSAFAAAAQSAYLDSPQHIPPLRPRISKANRYDMLLGD